MDLHQKLQEAYPDMTFTVMDGFDPAAIGICEESFRVVYSRQKCIDVLGQQMGIEDAIEYFNYNCVYNHDIIIMDEI